MEINHDFSSSDKILTILLPKPVFDIDQEIYSQTGETLEHQKYFWNVIDCLARKNAIMCEKTELQARTLIILWFCGQFVCPDRCCDWS